ncbi:hypothetical protein ACPVPU_12010 [Sphingomonas sp. CJ99]
MILMLMAPVLVQAAAQPAAPAFNPPLDADWHYRIEETREMGGEIERHRLDRTLRFARDGDGYAATMITTAVDGGIGSGPGAMFEATMATFIGNPVIFRLDAGGTVVSIDDLAAHYGRWSTAMIDQGLRETPGNRQSAVRKALGDRIAATPPAAQLAFLGSMLSAVLPSPDLPRVPTAAQPLAQQGAGVALTGVRRAYRTPDDRLAIEDRLAGTGTGPAGPFEMQVSETRELDATVSMLRSSVRVRRTVTGGIEQTITTRTTVDPVAIP